MHRWIVAALLVSLIGCVLPSANASTGVVEVHDNFFFPARIRIEPGDTIKWVVIDGGHTITSDNTSYEFPSDSATGGTVNQGDRYEFTFADRGVFYFHCRLHGEANAFPRGMTGAVYVGVSSDGPSGELRKVPGEYPTVKEALYGIAPGSTVSLAPGEYHEAVQLNVADVTLRGEGVSADESLLMPGG